MLVLVYLTTRHDKINAPIPSFTFINPSKIKCFAFSIFITICSNRLLKSLSPLKGHPFSVVRSFILFSTTVHTWRSAVSFRNLAIGDETVECKDPVGHCVCVLDVCG